MAVRSIETSGPEETESVGGELARGLRDGDLVLVRGELGAGKTTLVRGAARVLGVSGPVTSPTFSIGHRYAGDAVTVSHLDLYRLAGLEREEPELLSDYIGPGRIAFVEWPAGAAGTDRASTLGKQGQASELAGARVAVTLTHLGGDRRAIELDEP